MQNRKKVLVLGATGAMGQYLVPMLAEAGYRVDAVSLIDAASDNPNINYLKANAKESGVLRDLLTGGYDGIVDFMIYNSGELSYFLPQLLRHTQHYIYLSSYRIYDNKEQPIKESSPRLIDASDDVLLRNSDDYSIYKARGENILQGLPYRNWSAIRPSITYSLMRYQLVTLEASDTVGRAFAGKTVVLPEQARNIPATMSWAGDIARMIQLLLFNKSALGEIFTASTAEHHTWGEIAEYYREICKLNAVWVDKEDYLRIVNPDMLYLNTRWQLEYDRLFTRIMDNTKILAATGMKQSELMNLYDGLKLEIGRCPANIEWPVNARMDSYLNDREAVWKR